MAHVTETIKFMTVPQLRLWLSERGVTTKVKTKRDELLRLTRDIVEKEEPFFSTVEELVQNLHLLAPKSKKYTHPLPYNPNYSPNDLAKHIEEGSFYIVPVPVTIPLPPTPIEMLMLRGDTSTVLTKLGYPQEVESLPFEEKINLLWATYAFERREIITSVSMDELASNSTLAHVEKYRLYALLYRGYLPPCSDECTITHEAISIYSPRDVAKISRYFLISPAVWSTTVINQGGSIAVLSPYHIFLKHPLSILYPFITTWTGTNVDDLARNVGMIFPPSIIELPEKNTYFMNNLRKYEGVFTRHNQVAAPPSAEVMRKRPRDETVHLLEQYGDDELIDTYGLLVESWTSRSDFIDRILDVLLT